VGCAGVILNRAERRSPAVRSGRFHCHEGAGLLRTTCASRPPRLRGTVLHHARTVVDPNASQAALVAPATFLMRPLR